MPEASEFAGFLEKDRLEKLRFSEAILQGPSQWFRKRLNRIELVELMSEWQALRYTDKSWLWIRHVGSQMWKVMLSRGRHFPRVAGYRSRRA